MSTPALTSKGQVTIPKKVRTALGLKPGDRVAFHIVDDVAVLQPAHIDVRKLRGMLPRPRKRLTVEDMNRVIARAAVKRATR